MDEIWKQVKGFENYYVSNLGRIKNKNGRILKPGVNRNRKDYLQHSLYKNGRYHTLALHRIVLTNFVGDRPKGMVCCHCDGDKKNNKLSNLRWDTPTNNTLDQSKHGTSNRILAADDVRQIRKMLIDGMFYKDIAAKFNTDTSQISRIAAGKLYRWVDNFQGTLSRSGK